MFHFSEINSTNFSMSAEANFKRLQSAHQGPGLRFHQDVVASYAIEGKTRGLLVYHTPGMGKTLAAVAVADHFRAQGRVVIFMAPLSLHENFRASMRKYYGMKKLPGLEHNVQQIYFVSTNASNMFEQVARIMTKARERRRATDEGRDADQLADQLSGMDAQLTGVVPRGSKEKFLLNLNNTCIIVDECHDLANSITNLSSNASKLYGSIVRARDIKLLFLTGTPIVNDPFEIVPLLNMLRGYLDGNRTTLFPEYYDEFQQTFTTRERQMKNQHVFLRRISGLVSYYGDLFTGSNSTDFPEELPMIIEKVPMSLEQFQSYNIFREQERRKEFEMQKRRSSSSSKADKHLAIYSSDSKKAAVSSSSYRIKSRQASNFYLPAVTSGAIKDIEAFPIEMLQIDKLAEFSPKFVKMLENIDKHVSKGQLGLVYSEFVTGEGINLFSRTLIANGWDEYLVDDTIGGGSGGAAALMELLVATGGAQPAAKTSLRFAKITGEIDAETRAKLVNTFNTGKDLTLLLISSTGAQGLSLQNVRHIHMMEPYWNISRLRQVIGRGVRYLSHKSLKPEERNVQPYLYLSTYPEALPKKSITEPTTDESIYQGAVDRENLAQQFRMLLVRGSIDCVVHAPAGFGCFRCRPTAAKLYEDNLKDDLRRPETPDCYLDSADAPRAKTQKVKVSKVDLDPELGVSGDYYFTRNGDGQVKLYSYDESLHQYVELKPFQRNYAQVYRAVMAISPA